MLKKVLTFVWYSNQVMRAISDNFRKLTERCVQLTNQIFADYFYACVEIVTWSITTRCWFPQAQQKKSLKSVVSEPYSIFGYTVRDI